MRTATYNTLKALLRGDEVTALSAQTLGTTRTSNEILYLRRDYFLYIDTHRVQTSSGKWYGVYKLVNTPQNMKKARELLAKYKQGADPKG